VNRQQTGADVFEIIAIVAGLAVGLLVRDVPSPRRATALALLLGAAAGVAVTALSGELEISPAFLVFDAGQTALAAVLTLVVARRLRRSAARDGR
jgi:high-affinity Fe2+/Pb2+ permease